MKKCGNSMMNGGRNSGALIQRKRRSKNTLSSGSVERGGHKSGNSGSTVTVTLTAGSLAPVNGEATFGPSMNMVKMGRSGNELQGEGQYYRQQSFYKGSNKGGKKGGKGGGKGGRGK